MAMPTKKRVVLSLARKVEIIDSVEKGGKSRAAIADEYSVAKSTVTSLYSNRATIKEAFDSSQFDHDRFI